MVLCMVYFGAIFLQELLTSTDPCGGEAEASSGVAVQSLLFAVELGALSRRALALAATVQVYSS